MFCSPVIIPLIKFNTEQTLVMTDCEQDLHV